MILGLVGDIADIELRELRPHSPRGDGMVGWGRMGRLPMWHFCDLPLGHLNASCSPGWLIILSKYFDLIATFKFKLVHL